MHKLFIVSAVALTLAGCEIAWQDRVMGAAAAR